MTGTRGGRGLRGALVACARELADRGWVANHDGNATARVAADRFLATPTATRKRLIDDGCLIEVDAAGKRVAGTARPFGELSLHLQVYAGRDDVGAVVHAHPPHATALACSGRNLIERPFLAEAVVSIGPWIPLVEFAAPGEAARQALSPYVSEVDAVLLASHGVLAWGADLEQALVRMELVEHLARIATLAEATGGARPLPQAAMPALLAKRAKAGLGKAAERAVEIGARRGRTSAASAAPSSPRVVACAPAPGSDVDVVAPGGDRRGELSRLIREELVRALRDSG